MREVICLRTSRAMGFRLRSLEAVDKPVGTPDAGTFWRIISEYNVKSLFTAPTAFRAIKKEDPEGKFFSNMI